MSESLAVANPQAIAMARTLRPSSLEQAMLIATHLAGSPLLPPELQRESSLFLVILQAQDLGLSVGQALRGMHVIKGRLSMDAGLMMAICVGRPDVCRYFRCVKDTPDEVTYETWRIGDEAPERASFTTAMATAAGLLPAKPDSNWAKWPQDMMHARARSRLAKRKYPDLLFGVASREEVADGAAVDMVETSPGQYTMPPTAAADAMREAAARFAEVAKATADAATVRQASVAETLAVRIDGAADLAALQAVASEIKARGEAISADDRKDLLTRYTARKQALTPREREPGEDG